MGWWDLSKIYKSPLGSTQLVYPRKQAVRRETWLLTVWLPSVSLTHFWGMMLQHFCPPLPPQDMEVGLQESKNGIVTENKLFSTVLQWNKSERGQTEGQREVSPGKRRPQHGTWHPSTSSWSVYLRTLLGTHSAQSEPKPLGVPTIWTSPQKVCLPCQKKIKMFLGVAE